MTEISWFRGMAGEVVADFVSPRTFFKTLPVALVILAVLWVSGPLRTTGMWVAAAVSAVIFALATARHALAARHGELNPVNELQEIVTFSIGTLLLNLWLLIPFLGLTRLLGSRGSIMLQGSILWPAPLPLLSFLSLLQVVLAFALAIFPPLSLVMATRYGSLGTLFSREGWHWLVMERKNDLGAFFASLWGGFLLFSLMYMIPLAAVAAIVVKISIPTGIALGRLIYLVPLAALPSLAGRLCGTFVASERIADVSRAEGSLFTPTIVGRIPPAELVTAATLAEAKIAREPKPDLNEILKGLVGLDATEEAKAVSRAEAARAAEDRPLRHTIELALLSRKSGGSEKAVQYASEAIDLAAHRGFGDLGFSLFNGFKKDRSSLTLSPYAWELLGNILLDKGAVTDAAWCYCAAATSAGDVLKAQKKLLQMAQSAEKGGRREEALGLYELFLGQYPESTLAEFARQGKATLANKG